jgi:hypothetical protein|tara:strand:- start:3039 stop:3317 length:279 start_codon:yes stop_codon:yes gene_type:complete
MAWEQVEIEVGGKKFSGHMMIGDDATIFNIPPASELEEGGKFKVGGKTYTAASVHDVAQRGEELLVETKETGSGKSKTRGNDDSSGGEEVSG